MTSWRLLILVIALTIGVGTALLCAAPLVYDIKDISVVSLDTSGGPQTYTLPYAPALNQAILVKDWSGNAGTNPITVAAGSGGTIDGGASFLLQQPFGAVIFINNGLNWNIVGGAIGVAGGDLSGTFPNPTVAKINGNPLGSTTPTSANLLIANGSLWASTAMSGDTTITSGGVVTVGRINTNPLGSTTPTSANLLIANGSLWASTAMSGDTTITSSGAVNVGKINGNTLGSTTPTSGNLLIGNGSLWASVGMSGDATINSSGAVNVGKINGAALGTTTATPANILVANGSNQWTSVAMSGGATISSSGVVTLSGSLPPNGTAGGDLSGSYPNPTVAKINGAGLGTTTATAAHILVADGSNWQSVTMSGGATINTSGVVSVTHGAHAQATAAAPAGTLTSAMMGLAGSITPATSGVVEFLCGGYLFNSNSGGVVHVQIYYGTGTAPVNGAAITGTAVGLLEEGKMAAASQSLPFGLNGLVTGLTPGTAYWFDIGISNNGAGGTATVANVTESALEQ